MKHKERLLYLFPLVVTLLFLLLENKKEKVVRESITLDQELFEVGLYDSLFMKDLTPVQDFTGLSADFLKFYDRFQSDASFQQKHIRFPLKGVCFSSCDSTAIWDEKTWNFLQWDFRTMMEDSRYNNDLKQGENKLFFRCVLKDFGILYELGFIRDEGKWMLVYCLLNAC